MVMEWDESFGKDALSQNVSIACEHWEGGVAPRMGKSLISAQTMAKSVPVYSTRNNDGESRRFKAQRVVRLCSVRFSSPILAQYMNATISTTPKNSSTATVCRPCVLTLRTESLSGSGPFADQA